MIASWLKRGKMLLTTDIESRRKNMLREPRRSSWRGVYHQRADRGETPHAMSRGNLFPTLPYPSARRLIPWRNIFYSVLWYSFHSHYPYLLLFLFILIVTTSWNQPPSWNTKYNKQATGYTYFYLINYFNLKRCFRTRGALAELPLLSLPLDESRDKRVFQSNKSKSARKERFRPRALSKTNPPSQLFPFFHFFFLFTGTTRNSSTGEFL